MDATCEQLVEAYLDWLRANISVADLDGACEITTPFLDRHNDMLQIYAARSNGGIRLTDDGYTLGDLEASGVSLKSAKRREMLQTVLNGVGVCESDGELCVETSLAKFPQKKHSLLQAMLAVNDMFLTASPRVASLFLHDVESFLEASDVRFSPAVEFTGHTGFVHKFDFLIPRSRTAPERLLRAINRPNRDQATSILFSWTDTKANRPGDSQFFVLLNDEGDNVNVEVFDAFKHYDVTPIPWSKKDEFLDLLAA